MSAKLLKAVSVKKSSSDESVEDVKLLTNTKKKPLPKKTESVKDSVKDLKDTVKETTNTTNTVKDTVKDNTKEHETKSSKVKSAAKSVTDTSTLSKVAALTAMTQKKTVAKSPVKKVAAKSPVKKVAKKSPKASPVKKVAKKSPKASPRKVSKKSDKKTTKGKGKVLSKKVKSKRIHNTKPATMDTSGIGIGPARVKAVLMNVSLNPREFAIRRALLEAENKPHKPKPTEENPNPELPPQGPQVPVDELDPEVLQVVHEAEAAHEASLLADYERAQVTVMDEKTTRVEYNKKRRAAQLEAEEKGVAFVLYDFNLSYNKDFYAGYAAYKDENDSYVAGKLFKDKEGKQYEKYNQWTRAMALVNKLCIRLSGNTRNIIACFLDRIVEQYAHNGIHNCLLVERNIVRLQHTLCQSDGFNERVPLSPFVGTLKNYTVAIDWIESCRTKKEENKSLKADGKDVETVESQYPSSGYEYDFSGYVGEICRSVKMQLASKISNETEKALYLKTSVSSEFKQFCSCIIYETILRIGASLRLAVKRSGVKTISDSMVQYVLEQIHSICGMDYTKTEQIMTERLMRFGEWRGERKEERKRKRKPDANNSNATTVEDEDDADEDDDVEEEEVDDPDVPDSVDADDADDDDIEVEYEEKAN